MHTQRHLLVLAVGVCLAISVGAALDGTARYVVQGTGVLLLLIGVTVVVARAKKDGGGEEDLWLPSRDEDQR